MTPDTRQTWRIVIQQIHADGETRFRLVAYDDGRLRGFSEFETAFEVQKALHAAIPDFPASSFAEQLNNPETHIVLDLEVSLDDAQCSLLRLLPRSSSHRYADGG